jgi:hypothetical protein
MTTSQSVESAAPERVWLFQMAGMEGRWVSTESGSVKASYGTEYVRADLVPRHQPEGQEGAAQCGRCLGDDIFIDSRWPDKPMCRTCATFALPASSAVSGDDKLADEVQRRLVYVADAAVAWHQGGGDDWARECDALEDAIERLLELRLPSVPTEEKSEGK